MGAARKLFESHLARLQATAESSGKHLADVLLVVMGPHAMAATFGSRKPPLDLDDRAQELAETYRARFMEELADLLIPVADASRSLRSLHRGSRAGGKSRGRQLAEDSMRLREAIVEKEAKFITDGVPARHLTKKISTALDLSNDYVRKVRAARARSAKRFAAG